MVNAMDPLPIFTCIACQVGFRSAEQQREHYHTDWHRYNLKRKIVQLPPITAENFTQRLQAQKKEQEIQAQTESLTNECKTCGKAYNSRNAYENHLASRKHKEMEIKAQKSDKTEEKTEEMNSEITSKEDNQQKEEAQRSRQLHKLLVEAESEEEVVRILKEKQATAIQLNPETDCIFCTHQSESIDGNMQHMTDAHSFFIPDIEYLVDLRGLLAYLCQKISVENTCLYCNGKGKSFFSLEGVRKHMLDKGHMKMAYEDGDELEYGDFYDFSATWEDVPEGAEETEESTAVAVVPTSSQIAISADEMELILPNGNRLGHRSLQRYYKQSFKPREEHDAVLINRLAAQYRALGWYNGDLSKQPVSKEQKIIDRAERRSRFEFNTRIGLKANGLQRHFREQIDY